jgi:hypothetical protein
MIRNVVALQAKTPFYRSNVGLFNGPLAGLQAFEALLKFSMPRSIRRRPEQLPQAVLMRYAKSVGG